jgi:HAD superfamily hydrolase (TIGR01548 family)
MLAAQLGVTAERVLVTAGGDDAIDRVCRAFLWAGRECVLAVPTFEMIARGARLAGATVRDVEWPEGAFPADGVIAEISKRTGLIAVVSPNNPTGCVATGRDLERIAAAASAVGALVMVDAAYAEFAGDELDLTSAALSMDNCVVIRTFSKARGLAGLRVGYAAGPEPIIQTLRAAGGPFPTSTLSLAAAELSLEEDEERVRAGVQRVCVEREMIQNELLSRSAGREASKPAEHDDAAQSRANFVLARFGTPERRDWAWGGLLGLGIAVRRFAHEGRLADAMRITCPGDEGEFARLLAALRAAASPEAILLDMDGVLADVSRSYRAAIIGACASFGVNVNPEEIAAAKAAGNANNDWVLSQRLLAGRGLNASLEEVTRRFEGLYQGQNGSAGLRETETLIPPVQLIERLSKRIKLGIVTGRPRADAVRFLNRFGIARFFGAVVCMEDGPLKPDPWPVREAMRRLDAASAWMVGDTIDDLVSARGAGAVPVGIVAPQPGGATAGASSRERATLLSAGGLVVDSLNQLEEVLA